MSLLTGGIVMAQMAGQKSDELISQCKERLDRVLDRRKLAVESARAVWKIGNAVDQDLSELRKALEEVKSSGVGQDSYVTESSAGYEGESGPKFVQALASWCTRLNDSRMSAYKALTSAAKSASSFVSRVMSDGESAFGLDGSTCRVRSTTALSAAVLLRCRSRS